MNIKIELTEGQIKAAILAYVEKQEKELVNGRKIGVELKHIPGTSGDQREQSAGSPPIFHAVVTVSK